MAIDHDKLQAFLGMFVGDLGALKAEPRITEAFRTGGGVGWHEHDHDVFVGCEQFSPAWLHA